jgi:hypothetical protein
VTGLKLGVLREGVALVELPNMFGLYVYPEPPGTLERGIDGLKGSDETGILGYGFEGVGSVSGEDGKVGVGFGTGGLLSVP